MLSALITPSDIKVGLESSEKEECFAELLEVIVAKNPGLNRNDALNVLVQREEKMSTAVFPYIAVPHAVSNSINKTLIAIGVSRSGIEFEPIDSEKSKNPTANIIFEILFQESETDSHLHVLRDILQLASSPDFVKNVLQAKTSQEVYDIIMSLEL